MLPVRFLLTLVLLLAPSTGLAEDLEDFFPGLLSQISVEFSPVVFIDGSDIEGEFDALQAIPGLFDVSDGLSNLSAQIGTQAQRNPIGSAIAAFTFEFDPGLNVFTRTTEGLGPLLSERAQTTGKGKLNIAFSFAHVDFNVFEGDDLDDLDVSFDDTVPFVVDTTGQTPLNFAMGMTGGASEIVFFEDLELGPDSPIRFVSEGFFSGGPGNGTIIDFEDSGTLAGFHVDDFETGEVRVPDVRAKLDAEITAEIFSLFLNYGITDKIDLGLIVPFLYVDIKGSVKTVGDIVDASTGESLSASARKHESDFGLGDITARLKMNLVESQWIDVGVRGDVILPTGDEEDFMGFGDPAFALTAIFSKSTKWVSPHANGGILLRINDKEGHAARWSAGVDLNVHERASLGVDFVGEHNLDHDGLGDDILGVSGGLKLNLWKRLVVTATALVRLNSEGLRADVIPSGTIEYTFN